MTVRDSAIPIGLFTRAILRNGIGPVMRPVISVEIG